MSSAALAEPVYAHNELQRSYYRHRLPGAMVPVRTPYVMRQIREMISFVQLRPGERVLDVGCGAGRHAFLLAEHGFRVDGMDLSPELLSVLRRFDGGRYGIRAFEGDIQSPPKELWGRYDAVVGFFVLHHVADVLAAMRGAARLLRPGGRIAFMEPNPWNPLYYFQVTFTPGMSWKAERGILNMRESLVLTALRQAGFQPYSVRRYGFLPRFVFNQAWGNRLDTTLEKCPLWDWMLPFQLFGGRRT